MQGSKCWTGRRGLRHDARDTPGGSVLGAVIALGVLAGQSVAAVQRVVPLELVLISGRVLDPETGLDAIRNVGIRGGRIAVVAPARTIPRGLVVVPGPSWYARREGKSPSISGCPWVIRARGALLDRDSTAEGSDVIATNGRFVREAIAKPRFPCS